ncbi:hypothetical protein MPY17_39975 (plasmid) [Rhodococcus opacus]|uniref:hypothetical protein n=1 Tax=Rhodococcus opacus TaxID=37919 RepID=UPI001FF6270D|nr:hypothetical protein [Rhodococcus opacus]UOT08443.1 hypothetical protein MPY17_39975 [Rhodococcus opacus]
MHAFADESRRGDYLVCAATIAPADLTDARKALKALRAPKAARIHMSHDSRRAHEIIRGVVALDVQAHLYVARLHGRPERRARDEALAAMVTDLDTMGVRQLWLESCDQDRQDRHVIRTALMASSGPGFPFRHALPTSEPMLWVPDVIAWAWGKGGHHRKAVADLVEVHTLP